VSGSDGTRVFASVSVPKPTARRQRAEERMAVHTARRPASDAAHREALPRRSATTGEERAAVYPSRIGTQDPEPRGRGTREDHAADPRNPRPMERRHLFGRPSGADLTSAAGLIRSLSVCGRDSPSCRCGFAALRPEPSIGGCPATYPIPACTLTSSKLLGGFSTSSKLLGGFGAGNAVQAGPRCSPTDVKAGPPHRK